MPEARNRINPLKSSLVSQFLHTIKVEMHTYPASAPPTQLKPYHVCWKDFLSSQLASEIWKDARPERHGHIERSNSTLGNKSSLARGQQRPAYSTQANRFVPGASSCVTTGLFNLNFRHRIKYDGQPVVLFPGNLEIPRIFLSIGHSISPDAQSQFLT